MSELKKIKVLHIIWSADIGGIEKVVLDIARLQKENSSLEIEVLICRETAQHERFDREAINYSSLGMKNASDISISKSKYLKKLFAAFDILHFHSFNPFVGWRAAASGKKIFYTEHGNFGFGRKQSIFEKLNNKLLKKFLNKNVNFISFNSEFAKRTAEARYGLSGVNTKVIYNGIDFSNIKKANRNGILPWVREKMESKFVVGTCARFVAVKKIERLIKAFAVFSKNKKNVCLLLCGDGPFRSEYEKLVLEMSISDMTIFTGFIANNSSYEAAMDVAVYSSKGEAFGLAAVESLAVGVPVIVFDDGGGLVEIAEKVSADDIVNNEDNLISRLNYYYSNPDAIITGRERRREVAAYFNIEQMGSNIFEQYKNLTTKK